MAANSMKTWTLEQCEDFVNGPDFSAIRATRLAKLRFKVQDFFAGSALSAKKQIKKLINEERKKEKGDDAMKPVDLQANFKKFVKAKRKPVKKPQKSELSKALDTLMKMPVPDIITKKDFEDTHKNPTHALILGILKDMHSVLKDIQSRIPTDVKYIHDIGAQSIINEIEKLQALEEKINQLEKML